MSFPTPFSIGHTSSQKGQSPAQRDSENAVTSEKLTKQTNTMIFFQILHEKANSFLEESLPLPKSKDSQSHKYSVTFVAIIVNTYCNYLLLLTKCREQQMRIHSATLP